jgi:hypothetical protein
MQAGATKSAIPFVMKITLALPTFFPRAMRP